MSDDGSTPVAPPPAKTAMGAKIVGASPQLFLGGAVIFTFIGIVGLLCFHVVPQENREELILVVGVIVGSYKDVIGFFFGSTSSSKAKDDTISKLAAAPLTTGSPQ